MNKYFTMPIPSKAKGNFCKEEEPALKPSLFGRATTRVAQTACLSLMLAMTNAAAAAAVVSMGCVPGESKCSSILSGAPFREAEVGTFSEPASFAGGNLGDPSSPVNIYWLAQGTYSSYGFNLSSSADNSDGVTVGRVDWIGSYGALNVRGLELSYRGPGTATDALVTMNIRLAGSTSVNGSQSPGSYSGLSLASAQIAFHLDLYDIRAGGNYNETDYQGSYSTTVNGLGQQIAGGGYDNTFDAIVGASTTIPVGSFDAGYYIQTTTSVGGSDAWTFSNPVATADLTGVGWVPGMRVFDTPEGFYVNSADGLIVDNVFMPSAVPVPAAVWLFGSGLAGLLFVSRRRQRPGVRS